MATAEYNHESRQWVLRYRLPTPRGVYRYGTRKVPDADYLTRTEKERINTRAEMERRAAALEEAEKIKGVVRPAEALRRVGQGEITRWVVMAGVLQIMKKHKITLAELFDFQKAKGEVKITIHDLGDMSRKYRRNRKQDNSERLY